MGYVCLQSPMEDRREGQIPWKLKLQAVGNTLTEVLELNSGSLEDHYLLLTTEPSLEPRLLIETKKLFNFLPLYCT